MGDVRTKIARMDVVPDFGEHSIGSPVSLQYSSTELACYGESAMLIAAFRHARCEVGPSSLNFLIIGVCPFHG